MRISLHEDFEMAYDYDKLYASTPQALGDPSPVFHDFFTQYEGAALRVLDIGCGQGRDALFIARLGHSVVGVDLSPHGVREMIESAGQENLAVTGIVADVTTYQPDGLFDVLLIDRTLHMLAEQPRLATLRQLIGCVGLGGWVLISDEVTNISGFQSVFAQNAHTWTPHLHQKGNLFLKRE